MKKERGFTLIELMVVIVFGLVLITFVLNIVNGSKEGGSISFGINGMTEMRCIDGFKFIVGHEGQARQVMDEFGKGVRCQ